MNLIKPARPLAGSLWTLIDTLNFNGYDAERWLHKDGYAVISALEVVEGGWQDEPMPHYHLSISRGGKRRCSSMDAKFILKQFGLSDALEDNHVPNGFVRNFFMPVAEDQRGAICKCNDTEPAIREDKGDFIWRGAV